MDIDPQLANEPPVASQVFVQPLEKGLKYDAILTAVIDRKAFDRDIFAFESEDGIVVLHDDGNFPDSIKADGRFHGLIKINFTQLEQEEQAALQDLNSLQFNKDLFPARFNGRVKLNNEKDLNQGFLTRPQIVGSIKEGRLFEWFRRSLVVNSIRKNGLFIIDSLVINDPQRTFDPCTKVGDPNNVWSFWHLLEQMAPTPGDPEAFIRNWLHHWAISDTINSDIVPARPNLEATILRAWETHGKLDPTKTPFKLIAIVNRLDLRANIGYSSGNAGEGRFVFNLMLDCSAQPMTVILESGINKRGCNAIKAYAKEWYNLKDFTPGSPDFNTRLEIITRQFSERGTNSSKPNGSSLNQLRTNEIAFGRPWQLREFVISESGMLDQATTKKEPMPIHFGASIVDNFVNANALDISDGIFNVPEVLPGNRPFVGGQSLVPFPPNNVFWNGGGNSPGIPSPANDEARFQFSLNTCSGCHGGEAGTFFQHVRLQGRNTVEVSRFLTGDNSPNPFSNSIGIPIGTFKVLDPANRPSAANRTEREFDDLDRRAADLYDLVHSPCVFNVLTFKTLAMTH